MVQKLHRSLPVHQGLQITSARLKQILTTTTKRRKFEHLPTSRPTSFQVKFVESRHVFKTETLDPIFSWNCLPYTVIHENVCGYATKSFFAVCWTCWTCCVLILLYPSKKWLKWNWNGHWEWLQEAWTLKIGSDEPEMCWGCVGGRGLFVVSKRGSSLYVKQLNGLGILEVSSPKSKSEKYGEIFFSGG